MKKRLAFLAIATVCLTTACSNSGSAESDLKGSWETNDDCPTRLGDGLEFEDDSVSVVNGEPYKEWSMNDDKTIITLSHSSETREYDFKTIDSNAISITEPDVKWQDSCELTRSN